VEKARDEIAANLIERPRRILQAHCSEREAAIPRVKRSHEAEGYGDTRGFSNAE
jgi:hypothetical protein